MLNRILLWDWEYFLVPTSTSFLDPFFKYEGGNLSKETAFSSGIYLKAFGRSAGLAAIRKLSEQNLFQTFRSWSDYFY